MRSTIIIDVDHTISDAAWRDNLIGGPWDDYHTASATDQPIDEIAQMLQMIGRGFFVVGCTARPEKWRGLTMQWLTKHGIQMDELLMRPDDDYRPAPVVKVDLCKRRFGMAWPHEIAFVMDDRDDVAAAFKAEGITVLQVHARRTEKV